MIAIMVIITQLLVIFWMRDFKKLQKANTELSALKYKLAEMGLPAEDLIECATIHIPGDCVYCGAGGAEEAKGARK